MIEMRGRSGSCSCHNAVVSPFGKVPCRHLHPFFVVLLPFTLVPQLTHEHALCIMVVTARQRLIEEVRSSRAVIIVGETGSGKTTRMLASTQLFLRGG